MNNTHNEDDTCSLNDYGHKYFIYKTIEVFEPFNTKTVEHLYIKKEYAMLGCNCGSVIKKEIKVQ